MSRRLPPQCHKTLSAELSGDGYEAKCWLDRGHDGAHHAPGFYPRIIRWNDDPFPRRVRLFRWLPG